MAIADVYRVSLNWICAGHKYTNVIHVEQTSSDAGEDPEEKLHDGLKARIETHLLPVLSDQCLLNTTVVKCIHPAPRQARTFFTNVAGTATGDPYPPGANVTLSLYSTTFSKRGRGRIRMGGFADEHVENTNATVAFINACSAWITAIVTAWSAAGSAITYILRVWSTVDTAAREIKALRTQPNIRALRSRRKN